NASAERRRRRGRTPHKAPRGRCGVPGAADQPPEAREAPQGRPPARAADVASAPPARRPAREADVAPEPALDLPPSAAAYPIFTAGSSGRPKALSVTQGRLATLLTALRPMLALGPGDRYVSVTTFTFDIALVDMLAPVLAGGCVVIADAEQALDAARQRKLL